MSVSTVHEMTATNTRFLIDWKGFSSNFVDPDFQKLFIFAMIKQMFLSVGQSERLEQPGTTNYKL